MKSSRNICLGEYCSGLRDRETLQIVTGCAFLVHTEDRG